MKLTFVTPRYGVEVTGGAELGARMLAEHLVAGAGWEIDVLTTCARDSNTWDNWYVSGSEMINGIVVQRFVNTQRSEDFDAFSQHVMRAPQQASPQDSELWIEKQGPTSQELLNALRETDSDAVAFYPYLYHPTVAGIQEVQKPVVLHPAAHDEPPIYLPVFHEVFNHADAFAYHTTTEQQLVERLFPIAQKPAAVCGLGVDTHEGDPKAARTELGLDDAPYVICVGRVDDGKGTGVLSRFFSEYKKNHPSDLKLVFVGPVVNQPLQHPDVVVAGRVSEECKWGALRGAELLVSPSGFESFALVLFEAWLAGTPVLVNGRCGVTAEHAAVANGGASYESYPQFATSLDLLLRDSDLRAELAENGRIYTEANYRWPEVLRRYTALVDRLSNSVPV